MKDQCSGRVSWEAFGLCVKSLAISCNHRVPSQVGSEPCVFSQVLQSSHTSLVLCSLGAFHTVCGALPCRLSEKAPGIPRSNSFNDPDHCTVLGGENQDLFVWNLIDLGTVQCLPPTPPPWTCEETPTISAHSHLTHPSILSWGIPP